MDTDYISFMYFSGNHMSWYYFVSLQGFFNSFVVWSMCCAHAVVVDLVSNTLLYTVLSDHVHAVTPVISTAIYSKTVVTAVILSQYADSQRESLTSRSDWSPTVHVKLYFSIVSTSNMSSHGRKKKAKCALEMKTKCSVAISHMGNESCIDGTAGCYWAISSLQSLAEFVNNSTRK